MDIINAHSIGLLNEQSLKKVHLTLNESYYRKLYGSCSDTDTEDKKIRQLENAWFGCEEKKCAASFNCQIAIYDKRAVYNAMYGHQAYRHPLFDYLMQEASVPDMCRFIQNESILNLEFYDYLALSVIGVADNAKMEITRNMWDEAGRGDKEQSHTVLFGKLMRDLDLHYNRPDTIRNMAWEGIAGINLFSYFALYPQNKMKYFGMLAATEMLDPIHYGKLIKGLIRLFGNRKIDYSYYSEHEVVDVGHAQGWLEQVVLPALSVKPEQTVDFWLGFYMRLESVRQYYDQLYFSLKMKQAV